MADGEVVNMVRWALENPERGAMAIVLAAGGWRILREIMKDIRGTKTREETLIETLMRENDELRRENHELRNRSRGDG